MKAAGCVRTKTVLSLLAFFLLVGPASLFATDSYPVVPSVPEGTYSSSRMISFLIPEETRLSVSLDGGPAFDLSGPLLLPGNAGEDRTYAVDAELRSFAPDAPVLARRRFSWRIDRKPPLAPVFSVADAEGGRLVTAGLAERGTIFYELYHPYSETLASGTVEPGTAVFLPDGAVLCAFARDLAGNAGPAASVARTVREREPLPFKIVNPVSGNWSNPQVLLVDAPAGTDIYYSLDGSDPSSSGLAYSGPVSLEAQGGITLRVSSVDSSGKHAEAQVLYTVTPKAVPPELGLLSDGSLAEMGEFGEISIPEGYLWSFDDAVPAFQGGRQVLFSAVRGIRRHYPLTVSDGTSAWRWVCASGTAAPESTGEAAVRQAGAGEVRIHDWHFVSVDHPSPVYYSLDGKKWNPYEAPVFVDRKEGQVLYWYAADWMDGERQTVRLPAMPRLSGIPANGLTGNPVFISAESSDFEFHYAAGSGYQPAGPTERSPLLASGLLAEVPAGASAPFTVRLLAVLDGIVHGETGARFLIDRKPPRAPSPGIPPGISYSRTPVTFMPSGEERIVVSIEPKLFSTDGKTFVLEGDPGQPVRYTVTVHAVDAAGNASPAESRVVTVDLNALYVDSARAGTGRGNGSPDAPFASLDDAMAAVRGTGTWRVYVKGHASVSRMHTIQAQVGIVGDGATLVPEKGAGFLVNGGSLSISDVTIGQAFPAPAKGITLPESVKQAQPLFDIRNGKFNASGLDVSRSGLSSLFLVRASGSALSCVRSRFDLSSADYALLFDLADSRLKMSGCTLLVSARDASALSLTATGAEIDSTTITVAAQSAGRAVEAWNSSISLKSVALGRTGETGTNRDTAFWLDKKSRIISETGVTSNGFWRYKAVEGK